MKDSEEEEIVEYLEKGPTFYNFSSDRIVAGKKSYSFLEDYVKPRLEKGMKVLDMGCGDGKTLSTISDTVEKGYGIEMDEERYKMAVKENKNNNNIEILKGDVSQVSFEENFDLVISERGPAIDVIDRVKEWLVEGGLFIVERIGEQHHRVFKEIMGRGQNYGEWDKRSAFTRERKVLENKGFEVLFMHNHFNLSYYKDVVDLVKNIFAVPTIDYRGEEDLEKLEEVEKRLTTENGIKLLNHYITYGTRKV